MTYAQLAMQLPDPVQWSEGMLLSPQHLQQNDIYWHEHLRYRLACAGPHFWGVRRLAVQLIKDTINISELECVLPNGVALVYPGNFPRDPDPLLQLDVSACAAGAAPLRVWLLVPERGAAAARQTDPDRRYSSLVGNPTADENTGDGEVPVGRLQVRYQLVLSASCPSSAQGACALLEIARDAQGMLRINDYLPPMLALAASAHLGAGSLQSQMLAYHETWWTQARQLATEASGFTTDGKLNRGGVRNMQVARQLASALPALSVLLDDATHPERLYQALAQVVGHVAQFAADPLPLKMAPYQHQESLPQFQAAWRYIADTLALEFERVKQDRLRSPRPDYEVLPFQAHGQGGFGRKLPRQIDSGLIIEIKLKEGQNIEDTGRWLSQADIAGASLIPQLQRQRVPGARIRRLGADEIMRYQLPTMADLFMIENRAVELAEIGQRDLFIADQSLLIHGNASPHAPAAIFLYQKMQPEADSAATGITAEAAGAAPAAHPAHPTHPVQTA